jgi:hypothetical protein
LIIAIQAIGESKSELNYTPLSTQFSLLNSIEVARERNLFNGHKTSVDSVAFSPDNQYISSNFISKQSSSCNSKSSV